MSRKFAIEPTPEVARQLLRLRDINPNIVLGPEIEELADIDILRLSDTNGLTLEQGKLVQDLIDFNLRAVVIQQTGWNFRDPSGWLTPILDAAKRLYVRDIVVTDQINTSMIRDRVEAAGLTYHICETWSILPEGSAIPRDALFLCQCAGTNNVATLHPLSLEFERTIMIGDGIHGNSTALYPNRRTLIEVFNKRGDHAWLEGKTVRDIAFLFSTSYAISRLSK